MMNQCHSETINKQHNEELTITTLIAVIAHAAPYGTNIPLPVNTTGNWKDSSRQYKIQYDSFFGGHWVLNGAQKANKDGTYTDTIRGTVSGSSVSGAFNQTNFTWLADGWYLSNGSHQWIPCKSFTIAMSKGVVSGSVRWAI